MDTVNYRRGEPDRRLRNERRNSTRSNDAKATVHWRFTTEKARTKLHRLYPSQPVW